MVYRIVPRPPVKPKPFVVAVTVDGTTERFTLTEDIENGDWIATGPGRPAYFQTRQDAAEWIAEYVKLTLAGHDPDDFPGTEAGWGLDDRANPA